MFPTDSFISILFYGVDYKITNSLQNLKVYLIKLFIHITRYCLYNQQI